MKRAFLIIALGAVVAGCNQNRDTQDRPSQAGGPSQRSEYSRDTQTNSGRQVPMNGSGGSSTAPNRP